MAEAANDEKMEETEGMDIDQSLVAVDEEYLKKVSEDVQKLVVGWISEAEKKSKNFEEVLESLLLEEKKQRKADEVENTIFIVLRTVTLCYDFQKWKVLEEQIASFVRRHGQFKPVIQKMVQTCMPWVDQTPDLETKLSLLDALLAVAEGKLFVELERARLTMQKAYLLENDRSDVRAAAECLKDFQVETYGAVPKREKTEYILEQIRIFLATLDSTYFTRAKIRCGHIGPKTLKAFPDLALKFHQLEIEIKHSDEAFFEMAQALLNVRNVADNQKLKDCAATEAVFACILSKFTEEQFTLLEELSKDEKLEDIDACKKLLSLFTTHEIIVWPFEDEALRSFVESFRFSTQYGSQEGLVENFRIRTIQHNIRVVARYYTDIQMGRLAEFLGVDIPEMEKHLSAMVVAGEVFAKIDRLEQSIRFTKNRKPNEVVNSWRDGIDKVVHMVEATTHQIHRETLLEKNRKKKEKMMRKNKGRK